MKGISWRLGLAAACAALAVFGRATPAVAAEEDRGGPADRLERLERRVNEMAQRQEQLMRRLSAEQERQAPMGPVERENLRRLRSLRGGAGFGEGVPPVGAPALAGGPLPEAAAPGPKLAKDIAGLLKLCLLVGLIFNILLAIWIFTDIRKRGEGSGIFVVLAIFAGVPAAIIYTLVRIGDKKA